MKIILQAKKAFVLLVSIVSCTIANAQDANVTVIKGVADVIKETNFLQAAMLESYRKPAPKLIELIGNRKSKSIPDMDVDLVNSIVRTDPFDATSSVNKTNSGIASPAPIKNFNGLNDNGTSIPPDVNGAVGPNHTMVTLNTQIRIQDKSGNNISTITLGGFWSSLGQLGTVYDPKVLYDHAEDRWIVVSSVNPQANNSSTLLAVSKTNDPTLGWNMFMADVDATNTKWVDFPSVGFNDRWIVVQMNLFPMPNSSATAHQIYVWDKADVYNNGAGVFTRFDITNEGTAVAVPSIHYDNSTSKMYLIRAASGNSAGKGTLTMRTVSGTAAAPILSSPLVIQTNNTWSSGAGTNGNFNPQLGSTSLINAGDHRMRQVVVRDGRIWATHAVFLPAGNPTRSSIQWFEFDTLGNIVQRSLIDDPTSARHFNYPSIAVNNKNDVLVGYSSYSTDQFASCSYSVRKDTDPINTMRDEYLYKYGENSYFKDFGAGRNRWGDYSNTVVDPSNDSVFWTIQEYAGSNVNNWATWWAAVDPNAQVADFASDANYICPGQQINFIDKSNFTGTNYNWTFVGGTPSSSTSASPTVTYNTAGKYRVTLEVDGKTQIKDGYLIVLANPIRTILKTNISPCGSMNLRASQSSGKYLWNTGATTQTISATTSGTYYCDIIAPNGVCSIRSDSVEIVVSIPTVTLADFEPVNPNKTPFELTGGLPLGGTYSGPGVSNGIFNPSVAGIGFHNISYKFTDSAGCAATATKAIEVTNAVGIGRNSKINSFTLIPNPSKGIVNISVVGDANAKLKIQVIDQIGRIVFVKEYDDLAQSIKKEIDLSSLPKGAYFVKAEFGDASETKKLIIE